jgi:hypothetical protein
MAIDTPARIAILGAGPVGLEAALYARFLGYDVDVFERGRPCEHLRDWGHGKLLSPFGWNASPLGIAALRAQDEAWNPPAADAMLTMGEFLEQYLLPLAASDLIEDNLRLQTEVLSVGRTDSLKTELEGEEERGDEDFRILTRGPDGKEAYSEAAVVIDCTGVFGQPLPLGPHGLPAIGEQECVARIGRFIPDILGAERAQFADRHTLVVGIGPFARKSIAALLKLSERHAGTRVTWLTRQVRSEAGPLPLIADDPLVERDRLAREMNAVANSDRLTWIGGVSVRSLAEESPGGPMIVQTLGETETELTVDRILADTGFRPETSIYRELQVRHAPATEAAETEPALITGEPNFYVLGAKSFGRKGGYMMLDGIKQVRELFKIIGDRESLDLYHSIGGARL